MLINYVFTCCDINFTTVVVSVNSFLMINFSRQDTGILPWYTNSSLIGLTSPFLFFTAFILFSAIVVVDSSFWRNRSCNFLILSLLSLVLDLLRWWMMVTLSSWQFFFQSNFLLYFSIRELFDFNLIWKSFSIFFS